MKLLSRLYHNPFISRCFPTTVSLLQDALSDCESVLDLGCGPNSPIQHCHGVKYSVGVEYHKPYLNKSRNKKIHDKYLQRKIEKLAFKKNEFDAVIMIEVLEHLPKKYGYQILKNAKKWAKKKVIITTPNGYIHQKQLDDNPLQKHLSGWSVSDLSCLGFKVRGLAGLKFLRQEGNGNSMDENIFKTIRFNPKPLWFVIATLSQSVITYVPSLAFELFAIYKHNDQKSYKQIYN